MSLTEIRRVLLFGDSQLTLAIPAVYMDRVLQRFDLSQAVKHPSEPLTEAFWKVDTSCFLCDIHPTCHQCPFGEWAKRHGLSMGSACLLWIVGTLKATPVFQISYSLITWPADLDKEARDQLTMLVTHLKERILWVD